MSTVLSFRDLIEDAIDALLAVRDAIEPDPDLEDSGDKEDGADDEPSLGVAGIWTAAGLQHDLEADDGDREDGGDSEPNGDEADLDGDEHDISARIPGGQGI
ncbi:hypothetical protein [Aurantimonas marina]|uniref:hypothetical protein n=1 Tax=Aurantimonas marina TaxID=2780508 RepID=UPI0019D26148|nr:hypothetical protein [Aurantimonas marina]